ncbi:hypothetical protein [Shewanella oncorhynchi]|uniref:hypothetical protein n=1 Tax=Shewanella oncorhynchi TaxID=2726434 RepID=UPI003D7BA784
MKPLSLSERLNQFATDQDDLSRRGEKNLATEADQVIDLLTAERDQLAAYVNALIKQWLILVLMQMIRMMTQSHVLCGNYLKSLQNNALTMSEPRL